MSRRTIVTVVLALAFAAAATLGVHQLMTSQKAEESRGIEMTNILVAATDITRGHVIAEGDVKTVEWPKAMIPPGMVAELDDAIGRSALIETMKDEPLFDRKLAARNAGHGLAALVPAGMRAFTIHTPTASAGVGGFILPGNKVDVLLTVNAPHGGDSNAGSTTTTLLQCVEILAVDQRLDNPTSNVNLGELKSALVWQLPSAVTLLVTPRQAATLGLAMDKGTLHLSLRNPEDVSASDPDPVTMADIRISQDNVAARGPDDDAVEPVAVPTRQLPPLEVRTLRGRQHGMIQVEQVPAVPRTL